MRIWRLIFQPLTLDAEGLLKLSQRKDNEKENEYEEEQD